MARPVEFHKINSLPGAKLNFPILHNEDLRKAGQCRLDMRIGIALRVMEFRGLGDHFFQMEKHVPLDVGVGVFVHRNGSGGVGAKNRQKPVLAAVSFQEVLQMASDIKNLFALRGWDADGFHKGILA